LKPVSYERGKVREGGESEGKEEQRTLTLQLAPDATLPDVKHERTESGIGEVPVPAVLPRRFFDRCSAAEGGGRRDAVGDGEGVVEKGALVLAASLNGV
jgi:hypothetical protein